MLTMATALEKQMVAPTSPSQAAGLQTLVTPSGLGTPPSEVGGSSLTVRLIMQGKVSESSYLPGLNYF